MIEQIVRGPLLAPSGMAPSHITPKAPCAFDKQGILLFAGRLEESPEPITGKFPADANQRGRNPPAAVRFAYAHPPASDSRKVRRGSQRRCSRRKVAQRTETKCFSGGDAMQCEGLRPPGDRSICGRCAGERNRRRSRIYDDLRRRHGNRDGDFTADMERGACTDESKLPRRFADR